MTNNIHINDDDIAKYCADLIDPSDVSYAQIHNHLNDCDQCNTRLKIINNVGDTAFTPLDESWMRVQLDQRRRDAVENIEQRNPGVSSFRKPAVIVGVGFFAISLWFFASQHYFQDRLPEVSAQKLEEEEELFTSMDFYLWLAQQDLDSKG